MKYKAASERVYGQASHQWHGQIIEKRIEKDDSGLVKSQHT
jgi:hypothetical protein